MSNTPNNRPTRYTNKANPETARRSPLPRYDSSDKRFFTFVIISSIIVISLIAVILSFAIGRARGSQSPKDPHVPDSPSTPSTPASTSALLEETEDMGQQYIDSMIFFGDSNTDHLKFYEMLNGGKKTTQVWSPKSQTVTLNSEITSVKIVYPETGEEMTVAEAAALKKPQYIVLSLGTNGVATLTESQFKYCYNKLVTAIKQASPNTKIIVQSIYPVTSSFKGFTNEKINTANGWLLDFCNEVGVKYADTASVLKDENGAMIESFNSDHLDGYHVNKAAYERILQYLRTHGYQ